MLQLRKQMKLIGGSSWNRRVATNIHLDYLKPYIDIILFLKVFFEYFAWWYEAKNITMHVEVVDTTLDHNQLLGHGWFYDMIVFMSSVFHTIFFPMN